MQSKNPFIDSPKLIFHGTYHKMGTVWLMRVLEKVAANWKLCMQKSNEHGEAVGSDTNIVSQTTRIGNWIRLAISLART